ncbi:hypothetical protein BJY01DRAFT_2528 [Aspergillus pseudoustus]|uniref:Uncharacterized protein n=1 Tax=Aspergillus pseudoustus TaxID=1810923 RepID=A0ABR4KW52_9EURO
MFLAFCFNLAIFMSQEAFMEFSYTYPRVPGVLSILLFSSEFPSLGSHCMVLMTLCDTIFFSSLSFPFIVGIWDHGRSRLSIWDNLLHETGRG